MRNAFDEQLKTLRENMLSMSNMCEEAIAKSVKAFTEGDVSLTDSVLALSEAIDRKEREIESHCLKLLLTQQPVAADLRTVSAALKMVTDLERIGNQSADISEIVRSCTFPKEIHKGSVHDMALVVIGMVNESVDAFAAADQKMAYGVISDDDIADGYFDRIKNELIEQWKTNPGYSAYGIDLLMIAKYLERIGDHAVNIAKWVIFSVTGEITS